MAERAHATEPRWDYDAARCPDCGGVPCPTCGTGCIQPTEAQLRVAAFRDRWSFKQGSLRERLEWARVQHQLQAELDAQGNRMPQKSDAESAAWHRACVEWYAEMVRDLDVMPSGVGGTDG